ncbi:hypothetical protein ANCDUO_26290 [Ancylostoma duodenale]|uniref:Uncharacterized protein n=1 Tax=Ancylostoma duodenale TaxID=51022 RepID=A0A0C2F9Y5_9BILA|nr:hypothetical protein ANCDUO_26290 [Ancylostoma duodenale]
MTICTFTARTLASEPPIEDLMMQARKIRYNVIGLTETRRHRPLNTIFDTVLVNTNLVMNIDSFEQPTTRIGRLRLRRCGSIPALTIVVAYAPASSYDDEEIEAFYMELERFYREDHTFYKEVAVVDKSMKNMIGLFSTRPILRVLDQHNEGHRELRPRMSKLSRSNKISRKRNTTHGK